MGSALMHNITITNNDCKDPHLRYLVANIPVASIPVANIDRFD